MSTQSVPHIWLQAPFLLPLEPICLQKTVFLADASSHSFSECKFSLQDWDYKSHPLYLYELFILSMLISSSVLPSVPGVMLPWFFLMLRYANRIFSGNAMISTRCLKLCPCCCQHTAYLEFPESHNTRRALTYLSFVPFLLP